MRQSTSASKRSMPATAARIAWVIFLFCIVEASLLHQAAGQAVSNSFGEKGKLAAVKRHTPTPKTLKRLTERSKIALLLKRVDELDRRLELSAAKLEVETSNRSRIDELEKRLVEAEKRAAFAEQLTMKLLPHLDDESPAFRRPDEDYSASSGQQGEIGQPKKTEEILPDNTTSQQDVPQPRPTLSNLLRFSGDFRLRADAILRPALTDPPPGQPALTHEQNVRARYRLRLNIDSNLDSRLSFHGQLSTGPLNDPLTTDQDFTATVARHPITISEAWIDYHPRRWIQLQGGRVQEIFADNSRFLFDDDVRFNGFNEKFTWALKNPFARIVSIEARAGQYIFSNPNVAIVTPGSPLAEAGAIVGSTGRSSNLFHQGLLLNTEYNEKTSGQFGIDIQLYRNPNQIQLASTTIGVPIIVQNGLGIALSGPLTGLGNATTTANGPIYTAPSFEVARLTYRLNLNRSPKYPITLNFQVARNVGIALKHRDALLAWFGIGTARERGDQSFVYVFSIKGANSLISQLTDNDLGTGSGVNTRVHLFRYTLGLSRRAFFQSLFFIQNELSNTDPSANFFVPLNAFTPRQYRLQQQLIFSF